jgi:flagellin-like protein
MKIGKFKVRRKALSPVIATLLMVAIAVAAAIITYVWAMGLLGGLMGTGGTQTKEQLILEAYDWKATGAISLIFRNVGSAQVSIAAVYLEGTSLSPAASTVAIAGTVSYSLTVAGLTITPGASYTLKVVTATGGTFSFSVVAGKAG